MSAISLTQHALSADPGYPRLKDYFIAATGLAYYMDKDDQLACHLARRIEALALPDCASYIGLLQSDEIDGSELDKLIAMVTIGETFFFRHHEAFNALRDVVLPDLIRRNQAIRKLRIWSAGCSIGAEPYSVAILLKREFGHLLSGWEISIIATDINREFLDRARRGSYEDWAFRSVPEDIKRECFGKRGNAWEIDSQYKEWISFQYHNLVKDPCPSLRNHLDGFDLILCRNVTIYFSQQTVRNLVQELYFSLPADGWLLVGHSEPNVEVYRSFLAVNVPGAVLYQKVGGESAASARTSPEPFSFVPQAYTLPPAPEPTLQPLPDPDPVRAAAWPQKPNPAQPVSFCPPPDLASIQKIADQGDLEEAARRCEKLLEREKLSPMTHFYYALILEQMGRRRETQESLRRAIYLDRNFIVAHYYLGLIQQRLGDPKQAFRCFRNALNLLSGLRSDQSIPAANEFTAAELKQVIQMHIDTLPKV